MKPLILVELEGTLIDPRAVQGTTETYEESQLALFQCKPHFSMMSLCSQLQNIYDVCVITSLPDKFAQMATDWFMGHDFQPDYLLMRPENNYEPEADLKPRLVSEYFGADWRSRVAFAIEDRDKLVDAWRAQGIMCCLLYTSPSPRDA